MFVKLPKLRITYTATHPINSNWHQVNTNNGNSVPVTTTGGNKRIRRLKNGAIKR